MNPVIDTLYVHKEDTYSWRQLRKIYTLGNLNWKSFENMFANALKLNKLPNQDLLLTNAYYNTNISEVINGYYVYNVAYMFYNCQSIYNIPIDFKLHKKYQSKYF
jgi:hypothetical protein